MRINRILDGALTIQRKKIYEEIVINNYFCDF